MKKSLAVYPQELTDSYEKKVRRVVGMAKRYQFDEVFTSLHLPEYSLRQQLDCFRIISSAAHQNQMNVTVDMGGKYIREILQSEATKKELSALSLDYIRLDYGFSMKDAEQLFQAFHIKGFDINASIYSEQEIVPLLTAFRAISPDVEIRACHNFYVKKNSGLTSSFAQRQDTIFHKYGIPVCYSVPTYSHPRQPMKHGLCTIENHRYKSIPYVVTDLSLNYHPCSLLLADEWLTELEFQELDDTIRNLQAPMGEIEMIPIRFAEGADQVEKEIVLQNHVFRYDSPFDFLRSQTSRQMAENARRVEPRRSGTIHAGDIIIDNLFNRRYSGELQVAMCDSAPNKAVNIAAHLVHPGDLVKLWRFREGTAYHFTE